MITDEEKQEIIDKAVEKALLLIPETVGNMMAHAATMGKLNRDFLAKHPEFKDHKNAVTSVIEKVEGKNPLMKYEDILEKSVPEIKQRISTMQDIDTSFVATRPNLNINGEL
jgi:Mg2+/Co2+ transporter CorC